jgi:acyl carrier protein
MDSVHAMDAPVEYFHVVSELIRSASSQCRSMEIRPDSLLLEELKLDSLDIVRVIMLMEDRYRITVDLDEVPAMKDVADLAQLLSRQLRTAA